MPISTRELSKIAKVSEQTVRNYTRDFGALLSPAARGEAGPRLFSDEDVQVFCTIATLRRDGVPPHEVIERVQRGDVYIEATPNRPHATPSPQHATPQSPQNDTDARGGDFLLPVTLSAMQSHIDALRADFHEMKNHQQTLLQIEYQRGWMRGAWTALAFVGFLLVVGWLWWNGAPW